MSSLRSKIDKFFRESENGFRDEDDLVRFVENYFTAIDAWEQSPSLITHIIKHNLDPHLIRVVSDLLLEYFRREQIPIETRRRIRDRLFIDRERDGYESKVINAILNSWNPPLYLETLLDVSQLPVNTFEDKVWLRPSIEDRLKGIRNQVLEQIYPHKLSDAPELFVEKAQPYYDMFRVLMERYPHPLDVIAPIHNSVRYFSYPARIDIYLPFLVDWVIEDPRRIYDVEQRFLPDFVAKIHEELERRELLDTEDKLRNIDGPSDSIVKLLTPIFGDETNLQYRRFHR